MERININDRRLILCCKDIRFEVISMDYKKEHPFFTVDKWPDLIFYDSDTRFSSTEIKNGSAEYSIQSIAFYYKSSGKGIFFFSFLDEYFNKIIKIAQTQNPKNFQLVIKSRDTDKEHNIYQYLDIDMIGNIQIPMANDDDKEPIFRDNSFRIVLPDADAEDSLSFLFEELYQRFSFDFELYVIKN